MPAPDPRNLQEEIGKHEPFELPEQEAFLNLVRTEAVLLRQFSELFREHGLSSPQYNALRIVGAAGASGLRSEAVGARLVALDPDTTRLLDRLEKAGYIERQRATDDRRCVIVSITAEGRRLLRKLRPKVDALHRRQLGHLTRAQLRQLSDLLFAARHP